MNRLYHLKETLIPNIEANADYENLDIILLDYNSGDDLEAWAKENLAAYIAAGRLTYYKTFEPSEYSHSHAKNLVFKLAGNAIVCSINADIFLAKDFAQQVNRYFSEQTDIFLIPDKVYGENRGIAGTVCVKKDDFLAVGGFDERMLVYGWEDVDFQLRLRKLGRTRIGINSAEMLKCIEHEERYDQKKIQDKIYAVFTDQEHPLSALNPWLLILFKDLTYKASTVRNNKHRRKDMTIEEQRIDRKTSPFPYELEENGWEEGTWEQRPGHLVLYNSKSGVLTEYRKALQNDRMTLCSSGDDRVLFRITDASLLNLAAYMNMDFHNRRILVDNVSGNRIAVNNGEFGKGVVYRNFNYDEPFLIQ